MGENEILSECLLVVSTGDECSVTSILPKSLTFLSTLCDINFIMCSGQFIKRFFSSVSAVGLTSFVFSLLKYVCLCYERREID